MFGIGGGEFLALIVIAVVLFGPEKIPEFSRKAARVVHYLRGVANNATAQLREELGPEYADLEIKDLTPKAFLQKALLDDLQSDIDEIKADLDEVKHELNESASDVNASVTDMKTTYDDASTPETEANELVGASAAKGVPFDPEAT